jgi:hypothetical protein
MYMKVIVPMLPLTGMRLHLEGKKNNRYTSFALLSTILHEFKITVTNKVTTSCVARHPRGAPVGHPDVHRRRPAVQQQAAVVARL